MRVKIITKDHGEFISDVITALDYNEISDAINTASQGTFSNFQFDYNGGKIFFTEEVLKTSVFIVTKD